MKEELKLFQESDLAPSHELDRETRETIHKSFQNAHRKSAVLKFSVTQGVAFAMTLAICPQFGAALVPSASEYVHTIFGHNSFVCALFCAGVLALVSLTLQGIVLNKRDLGFTHEKSFQYVSTTTCILMAFAMIMASTSGHYMGSLIYSITWFITFFVSMFFGLRLALKLNMLSTSQRRSLS